ncbi:MAG: OmpA family protein [Myxococcales bacterium]|nr:OmpA family protein [Myxococcales bacterium]
MAALLLLVGCASPTTARPTAPATVEPAPVERPPAIIDDDGDSIVGEADECPHLPEDIDGFQDEDGCPDRDNDGDGVLDAARFVDGAWINCDRQRRDGVDQDCRSSPEIFNGKEDGDGCPEVLILICGPGELLLRLPLRRLRGRIALPEDIDAQLVDVAAKIRAAKVEAHINVDDDDRAPQERAKRATQALADEILAKLVALGVPREQVRAAGYGGARPLADNRTAEGRASNRRLEIYLRHRDEMVSKSICEYGTPIERDACGCSD